MEATIVELRAHIARLTAENNVIKRVDEEMMSELKITIKQMEGRYFDLNEKMKGVKRIADDEKVKLNKIIDDYRFKHSELFEENSSLKSNLEKSAAESRVEIAALTQELSRIRNDYDANSNELNETIEELRHENAVLARAKDLLAAEMIEMRAEIAELEHDEITRQKENDECNEELDTLNADLLDKIAELTLEKNRNRKLLEENQELRLFNTDLESRNAELVLQLKKNDSLELMSELRKIISENRQRRQSQSAQRQSVEEEEDDETGSLRQLISELRQDDRASPIAEEAEGADATSKKIPEDYDTLSPVPTDPTSTTFPGARVV